MKPSELQRGDRIVHTRHPVTRKPLNTTRVFSAFPAPGKGVGHTIVNLSGRFGQDDLPDGISFGQRYDNIAKLDVQ